MTPPFPLPAAEDGQDPDPVEALLQLAANGRQQCSLSSGGATPTNTPTEHESDEGIVSDQSNEFDDKKVSYKIISRHKRFNSILMQMSVLGKMKRLFCAIDLENDGHF